VQFGITALGEDSVSCDGGPEAQQWVSDRAAMAEERQFGVFKD
jgi:hypothetical protein